MLGTPSFASTWLLDARLPTPSHRFSGSTAEDVAQWKAELLPRLRSTLLDAGVAELPAEERWPLKLKVLETETFERYEQRYCSYETREGVLVPAYLLVPHGPGPHPAAVSPLSPRWRAELP